jgi:phage-related protein
VFDQPDTCSFANKTLCPGIDRREALSRISLNHKQIGKTRSGDKTDEILGKHWINKMVAGNLGGKWIGRMLTHKSPVEQFDRLQSERQPSV